MSQFQLWTSLLKWLQTFELRPDQGLCRNLEDISDGVAMANVLHKIAPEWFSKKWLSKIKTDVGVNWRLKVSNVKKIVEGVSDYYQEYVNPNISFIKPDAVKIGEQCDPSETVKLLQLILGCAINCNNKHDYIKQIMEMEETIQSVIMQSIQELENLLGSSSSPLSITSSSSLNLENRLQIDNLVNELRMTNEARDQLSHRCRNLDMQLNALLEEKNILTEQKKQLEERVRDITSSDPMRDNTVRKQIEHLKEELFKADATKDDYRMKLQIQEKEMTDLQIRFDLLQQAAVDARQLKDELDILREEAHKAEKLEVTLQTYKKKLEELAEIKKLLKQTEEKNLSSNQQISELEEELKKTQTWKTQADVYKKQVNELRFALNEETKRSDRREFEKLKALEKLNALEKEKERLIVERDSLKEAKEELEYGKHQIDDDLSNRINTEETNNSITNDILSKVELKRELEKCKRKYDELKLSVTNRRNKAGTDEDDDKKLSMLQIMYDDLRQQHQQLKFDYRQANHKIMQLEADYKDATTAAAAGDKMNDNTATIPTIPSASSPNGNATATIKELQYQLKMERLRRASELSDRDRLSRDLETLVEALRGKEQECEELEEKFQKALEKVRLVAKVFGYTAAGGGAGEGGGFGGGGGGLETDDSEKDHNSAAVR